MKELILTLTMDKGHYEGAKNHYEEMILFGTQLLQRLYLITDGVQMIQARQR